MVDVVADYIQAYGTVVFYCHVWANSVLFTLHVSRFFVSYRYVVTVCALLTGWRALMHSAEVSVL